MPQTVPSASPLVDGQTGATKKVQLPNRPVKLAMVKNVLAVPVNAEVSECALKMRRARVDQIPVVNGDKRLVAMLYDRELIRALCQDPAE